MFASKSATEITARFMDFRKFTGGLLSHCGLAIVLLWVAAEELVESIIAWSAFCVVVSWPIFSSSFLRGSWWEKANFCCTISGILSALPKWMFFRVFVNLPEGNLYF